MPDADVIRLPLPINNPRAALAWLEEQMDRVSGLVMIIRYQDDSMETVITPAMSTIEKLGLLSISEYLIKAEYLDWTDRNRDDLA